MKGTEVDDVTEKSEEIKKRKGPWTNSWGGWKLRGWEEEKRAARRCQKAEGTPECGFQKKTNSSTKGSDVGAKLC